MKVYLCGPIAGCTDEECKDWRTEASQLLLHNWGIKTLDPMRRDYRDHDLSNMNEIIVLDKRDILESDFVLVNYDSSKSSCGTCMEILFSWENNKPVITVIRKGDRVSPWLAYHSTKIVHTFAEAYDWIANHL